MTFILKGYAELRDHFQETVNIVKKKYKALNVEALEEPRKSQINTIQYIIEQIDSLISGMTSKTPKASKIQLERLNKEVTLYLNGAMLLISTQITENLGLIERNSLLRDRLNLGLGIKEDSIPTSAQLNECYKALNKFFKSIFIENDSRKGLKERSKLLYVPLDTITALINRSYELEAQTQNDVLSTYTLSAVEIEPDVSHFKPIPVAASVTSPFTDWATLQKALNDLKEEELGDKNRADIKLLSKERAAQFAFLKALTDKLNTLYPGSEQEAAKIAILAGAMCIVREQISQTEYSREAITPADIPSSLLVNGPVTHNGLSAILKFKDSSPENIEALLHAANDFIMFACTEPNKFKTKHAFSDIKDFDLAEILKLTQTTMKSCRVNALAHAVAVRKLDEVNKAEAARLAKEDLEGTKKPEPSLGITGLLGAMLFVSKTKATAATKAKEVEKQAIVEVPVKEEESKANTM